MYPYRTPGVYFEWQDVSPVQVPSLRTDITGLVGITARGPLHKATRIQSWPQFVSLFGGHIPQGYLAYAVEGFFANGGRSCWVVRVANPEAAKQATLTLTDDFERPSLRLRATSPGTWAHQMIVTLLRTSTERFTLVLRHVDGQQEVWADLTMAVAGAEILSDQNKPVLRLIGTHPTIWDEAQADHSTIATVEPREGNRFDLTVRMGTAKEEEWSDLSLDRNDPRYAETVLNDPASGSDLLIARDLHPADGFAEQLRRRTWELRIEPRYVCKVLNDEAAGSVLVSAENLDSKTPFPHNMPGASLADIALPDAKGRLSLRLTASSPGVLVVTVQRTEEARFTLLLRHDSGEQEIWTELSLEHNDPCFVVDVLNNEMSGSGLVEAEDLYSQTPSPLNTPAVGTYSSAWLSGGTDGIATLQPAHLSGEGSPTVECWGLGCLESVDEVSIVAIPDIMPKAVYPRSFKPTPPDCTVLEPRLEPPAPIPQIQPEHPRAFTSAEIAGLQQSLVRQCEKLKDRVAILDPLPEHRSREAVMAWRRNFDTSYAALYFPWLRVPDGLQLEGVLRPIPPSGHIAGIYARGDLQVGVHKPPANQVVELAKALAVEIDDGLHGELNDWQINAIRIFSGRGLRVIGARTLSSDINLRYINVRRLLAMIKEAIEEGTQELVFEPHNQDLWRKIERRVRAFVDRLWRSGSLDGATAEAAYSVSCDRETNPPSEQDAGRVICEIGLLPPWPAEFVIVRIGFTQSGAEIIEGGA